MNALMIDVGVLRDAVALLAVRGLACLDAVAETGSGPTDRLFRVTGLRRGPDRENAVEGGGNAQVLLVPMESYRRMADRVTAGAHAERVSGGIGWRGVLALVLGEADRRDAGTAAFQAAFRRCDNGEICRIDVLRIRERLAVPSGSRTETLFLRPDGQCDVRVEDH